MSSISASKQITDSSTFGDTLRRSLRQYGMLIALVVIMGFFQWRTGGVLLRPLNITNLILQNSYIVIMAIGMLLVIVAGHIDLSVGSVVGFTGALAATMTVTNEIHWSITIVACLLVGIIIGAAQGYCVAFLEIPAFIVTLAGMLVFRGLSLTLLQGQSVGPFPETFRGISSGFVPNPLPSIMFRGDDLHTTSILLSVLIVLAIFVLNIRQRQNQQRYKFKTEPAVMFLLKTILAAGAILYLTYLLSSYRGFPNVLLIMFVLIVIYAFVTNQTTIGRRIYALGGNVKAAKLSGINTERLTFLTFTNMGFLAALAGLVFVARFNSATPRAGTAFELDVIAAVFIGGASAKGGVGTVIGAVIGAFVMGVMNNGMSILGVGIDWQQVIKGLVLLAAVFFDVYNRRRG
ncbi:MAG: multiple monosaccharide ABC transporter permease [Deinococcota bacterium]